MPHNPQIRDLELAEIVAYKALENAMKNSMDAEAEFQAKNDAYNAAREKLNRARIEHES